MRRLWILPAVACAVPAVACGTPVPSGTAPTSAAPTSAHGIDLHGADLRRITVPSELCDTEEDFALQDGAATSVPSGEYGPLDAGTTGKTAFGDLDGDGADEAATDVYCMFHGGWGVPAQGFVVLSGHSGKPEPVGAVVARYQRQRSSKVESVTLSPAGLVAKELIYRDRDPECCPSAHATTTWTYSGGKLVPGEPRLEG